MKPLLLDTHAVIWSAEGSLARSASRTIDHACARGELLISPITAWEIGMLAHKGRLSLTKDVHSYVSELFAKDGVVTATLTPAIAVSASALPGVFHGDPADRILVATAKAFGADFMTLDARIHAYARATKTIRCLVCRR